jgi:alkylation response protein AidB-like acyl-CoA dehydrogenase
MGAHFSDYALCLARSNWSLPKHRGLTMFTLGLHQPGNRHRADHASERRCRVAPDAAERVGAAKLYVGQKSTDIVQDCIQIHGGIGVTWEHDLHLYLCRVTMDRQLMGTPAEHAEHLATLIGL